MREDLQELYGDIERLEAENAKLKAAALLVYDENGEPQAMGSPEEVVEYRKKSARDLREQSDAIGQWKGLAAELHNALCAVANDTRARVKFDVARKVMAVLIHSKERFANS